MLIFNERVQKLEKEMQTLIDDFEIETGLRIVTVDCGFSSFSLSGVQQPLMVTIQSR